MNKLQKQLLLDEKGQSIVIVALFLAFVFLAFAALSIDGTIVYLRRRQLQNIADAAALAAATVLSQRQTEAEAYQTAMDIIAANEGRIEWYATSTPPDPGGALGISTNVGSGLDLVQGIEITDSCDVRVALRWSDIGTYFAQFVGRDLLQVGANAHTGCNRAGGLQPIAMKRFGDEFDTNDGPSPPNTSDPNTIYCDKCDTRRDLDALPPQEQGNGKSFDFFRPKTSDQDIITDWPDWPDPTGLYRSPDPHTTIASPGREFFFLGQETSPNIGNGSWAGLVNLDIRRPVGWPTVKYYNGIDGGTGSNTLKDMGEHYIRYGYCCDIPVPGDWVAMYNGTSASFSPQALQETYPPGDVIAIIIYNGTVFETPSVQMTGNIPNFKITYPTTTTVTTAALTYTIKLKAIDTFQSSPMGLTMNVEGLAGFADWSLSNNSPVLGHGGITERNVTLYVTPTLTTTTVGTMTVTHVVTGSRMFYVSAIDTHGTGVRRYWAGVASFGDTVVDEVTGLPYQRELPAVTGIPTNTEDNYPFLVVAKGKQANYSVELNLWGGAANQDVQVDYIGPALSTLGLNWAGGSTGSWTVNNVRASPPPQSTVNIKINVENTATADTTYSLPFLVTAANGMTATFNLYIFVEETESNVNYFVEVLGYAAVEILGYYNNKNLIDPYDAHPANTVRGRYVSELMQDPSQLKYGLRPRLIPWEQ
ncbi:MAG: pilus assembly protein TadG-related protein [Chloroflexota bacterium]